MERWKLLKAQAGFKLMTHRFIVNAMLTIWGKKKCVKLCLILLFILIGSMSRYGGVPYHLKQMHAVTTLLIQLLSYNRLPNIWLLLWWSSLHFLGNHFKITKNTMRRNYGHVPFYKKLFKYSEKWFSQLKRLHITPL